MGLLTGLPTLPLLLPTRRSLSSMLLLPGPPVVPGDAAGAAVELLPLRPNGLRAPLPPGADTRGLLPLAAAGAAWFVRYGVLWESAL